MGHSIAAAKHTIKKPRRHSELECAKSSMPTPCKLKESLIPATWWGDYTSGHDSTTNSLLMIKRLTSLQDLLKQQARLKLSSSHPLCTTPRCNCSHEMPVHHRTEKCSLATPHIEATRTEGLGESLARQSSNQHPFMIELHTVTNQRIDRS